MCLTISPANISNSTIGNFPFEGKERILFYQNSIKSFGGSINVMLLAVDGIVSGLVDTTSNPNIIKDIANSLEFINAKDMYTAKSRSSVQDRGIFQEQVGMYTVNYSQSIDELSQSLSQFGTSIPQMYLDFYNREYIASGKYTFLAFLWYGTSAIDAQPIAIKYISDTGLAYFPMIDGHDGRPVTINSNVDYDHTLLFQVNDKEAKTYKRKSILDLFGTNKKPEIVDATIYGKTIPNIVKLSAHSQYNTVGSESAIDGNNDYAYNADKNELLRVL